MPEKNPGEKRKKERKKILTNTALCVTTCVMCDSIDAEKSKLNLIS